MSTDLILTPPVMAPTIILSGEVIAAVATLEQRLGALPNISDQETLDAVRAVMNEAGDLARAVDAQRANAKAPWAEVANKIDAVARPIRKRLELCVAEAKGQIAIFSAEQDRLRSMALRAQQVAQAAASESLRQGNVPNLQVTLQPETFVLPTRTEQELEIVDQTLVPAQYWIRDDRKIEDHLRQGIAVPGARLKTVTKIVNR
jgi:hypothetical protein